MGQTIRLKLGEFAARLKADQKKLDRRVKRGLAKSARDGAHTIAARVPIAFGPLRASVHADVTKWLAGYDRVVVDAPHAAAVEVGSRPHMPPLAPILAWVKLRGMQGLRKGKLPGKGSRAIADAITAQIHAAELIGSVAIAIDVPEQIARAIQGSIAKHGTKPHFYVRGALNDIRAQVHTNMRQAVHGDDEG